MECCGVDSYRDWNSVQTRNTQFGSISASCCKDWKSQSECPSNEVFEAGCYDALEMRVHKSASVLIGVGIGIAFVEVKQNKIEFRKL